MISNLSATSKIKVSNLDIDKNDTYFKLEDLEITPSIVEQKFKSKKYGYDNVTVKAMPCEEITIIPSNEEQVKEGIFDKVTVAGDENLIPSNIKKGINVFGVDGEIVEADFEITNCNNLFYYNARFELIDKLLPLCKNVTSSSNMFEGCSMTEFNFDNFDTSKITVATQMFSNCKKLERIDLTNFNINKMRDIEKMFMGCSSLTNIDFSPLATTKAISISYLLSSCINLQAVNFGEFSPFITSFRDVFNGCKNIPEIDLSNFLFDKVTTLQGTFYNCNNLKEINFGNSSFDKVTTLSSAFVNCTSLEKITGIKNLGKAYTQKTQNYSNYRLDLSSCTGLTHDSLVDIIINGLYDLNLSYNVMNGGTLYTQRLQLGSTNLAKLTAEEIAIATNKGWTVS